MDRVDARGPTAARAPPRRRRRAWSSVATRPLRPMVTPDHSCSSTAPVVRYLLHGRLYLVKSSDPLLAHRAALFGDEFPEEETGPLMPAVLASSWPGRRGPPKRQRRESCDALALRVAWPGQERALPRGGRNTGDRLVTRVPRPVRAGSFVVSADPGPARGVGDALLPHRSKTIPAGFVSSVSRSFV